MKNETKARAARAIFLLGFMGCGKTTVGRRLAERLGRPFHDLDSRIEAAAGRAIAEIFDRDGEAAFRALETRELAALLEQLEAAPGAVVALGGGTFIEPHNRELLEKFGGLSVFLECPVERMMERCSGLAHRPLFRDPAAFRQLYQERLPRYRQACCRVDSGTGTPEQVAEAIARLIH